MPSRAANTSRAPAVAGLFYPLERDALRRDVSGYLAAVPARGPMPKAIVVPHAGYVYSAAVAAAAYGRLRDGAANVTRVVLLGPSHRVAFRGVALPAADAFATPLGSVPIDAAAREVLSRRPEVVVADGAHRHEHSLEVQLPFLQAVLDAFTLLPIVIGDASAEAVAGLLDDVWGGRETLIVVSTDLSHYNAYAHALRVDALTCRRIAALDPVLEGEDACGCIGVNALLLAAKRRGLVATQLAACNSGDTAGDRARVVGYAAFGFYPR